MVKLLWNGVLEALYKHIWLLKRSFHITRDVKVSLSSRVYSVQRLNLTLLLYLSAQAHSQSNVTTKHIQTENVLSDQ